MTSADITELLRASRPVAPASLHARVRELAGAGTGAPAGRVRLGLPRLRLVIPAVAATAVAAAALIAVVRPESPATSGQTAATADQSTASKLEAQAPPATRSAPAGTGAATAPGTGAGRAVDYQAQIGLQVKDNDALSSATKRAMSIARGLGGYVVTAQYATSESGTAQLTLRVPSARVQDAIAQLTALGTITSQQVQIQDLQEQLDALDRQIAVLRSRIAHITALLANENLTAVRRAPLEAERAQLQQNLRDVRNQRAGTAQTAAFATVQLALTTKKQSAVAPAPSRLHRTLDQAGQILTWEGVAVLYALVVVVPFALVGAGVWYAGRARRRSEESRLLARS